MAADRSSVLDTPAAVKRHPPPPILTRNRSDYSLPSTPKLLPRCHSENKFPLPVNEFLVDESHPPPIGAIVAAPSPPPVRMFPGSPTPSGRLRTADSAASDFNSVPIQQKTPGRHVTWGGATTTIRATYRFNNSRSSASSGGTTSALRSPASNMVATGSHSSPPSPRYRPRGGIE